MSTSAPPRQHVLSDEQWERIEQLLPSNAGRKGHPFRHNRMILEGIVYRYRTGITWRDLPREWFGTWQTGWRRHCLYARLGVWDRSHDGLMAEGDGGGGGGWTEAGDGCITRCDTHRANDT